MAMFAASLNNLKKVVKEGIKDVKETISEVVIDGVASIKRATEDSGGGVVEELGPPSAEADSTFRQLIGEPGTGLSDAPLLVRYEVQNSGDSDRESAAFPLPAAAGGITLGHLREHFPVPGRFHFRYKAPSLDGGFGGLVWADLVAEADSVPMYRGEICLRVLRIPDDADAAPVLPPIPGSALAAAAAAAACSNTPIGAGAGRRGRTSHAASAGSASELAASLASAFGGIGEDSSLQRRLAAAREEADQQKAGFAAGFAPAARHPRSSPSPSPPASEHGRGPSPPPPSTRSQPGSPPPGPPDDLMEMDCRGPSSSAGSAYSRGASPPPQVFDRAQLVREREDRVDQAVRDAAARQKKVEDEEAKLKADKVRHSSQLSSEFDAWARTPDGQAYKDIKVLISTMHTVAGPESSWKEVPLSELLGGPAAIKKAYRKAILVVHPDKQKDAPAEQQVRADRIFTALNEAFKISDEK